MNNAIIFWNWFKENQKHLQNFKDLSINDNLLSNLKMNLDNYCPNLGYILYGSSANNNKCQLIISTLGNKTLTLKAAYLISVAPKLPKWKFTASIKPIHDLDKIIDGNDPLYEFKNLKIKISDLMFLPNNYCPKSEFFDITVYLKDYWKHPPQLLHQAVTTMLKDLLGEHLADSKINRLSIEQLPRNSNYLIPAYDMEFYFESFNLD